MDKDVVAGKSGLHREISDDFVYNKRKLRHLKRVLHNVNISLGTLSSALYQFSKIKGPDISPDGLLGGLGYILSIKDIKESMSNAIESLSDISDSLADELTNPKWKASGDADVKKLLKEKENIEDKVEDLDSATDDADGGEGDEEYESEEEEDENGEDGEDDREISPKDIITSSKDRVSSFMSADVKNKFARAVLASIFKSNQG